MTAMKSSVVYMARQIQKITVNVHVGTPVAARALSILSTVFVTAAISYVVLGW